MRRYLSFALAVAMVIPAVASVAEAAVGTWLSPRPGEAVSGGQVEVAVGYNTQSDLKVDGLELWVDGKFYAKKEITKPAARGVASFSWDTRKVARGSHDLVIKIFAGGKQIAAVSGVGTVGANGGGSIAVDSRAPVVIFSNISSGDVLKGTTDVEISASDNSGEPPMVSLLVDDVLKLLKNTPPYSYRLDTSTYDDGSHQLTTYGYDAAGNRSDPVVVKVSFANGLKKPVVAAMTLDTSNAAAPAKKTASAAKPVPPVSAKTTTAAARAPEAAEVAGAGESGPVAASVPIPEPEVAVAGTGLPQDIASPAAAAPPAAVAVEQPVAPVAKEDLPPTESPAAVSAAVPDEAPRASSGKAVTASVLPEAAPSTSTSAATGFAAAEPGVEAPEVAEPVQVAAAPNAPMRAQERLKVMGFAAETSPAAPREAVSTSVRNAVASRSASVLHSDAAVLTASGAGPAAAPQVRTAMASDADLVGGRAKGAMKNMPTVIRQQVKARKEEDALPLSGKIKARALFEKLGGVLFWDADDHLVTVYVQKMKIELTVGSKVARVNGTQMLLDAAPYIRNGRTIVDAGVYQQARALVAHADLVARSH